MLAAFGIFAVGYLLRPIGGALIGYIGDRVGRPTALTISVVAMAVPTFLVGVLPGYEVLGIMAPILLTALTPGVRPDIPSCRSCALAQ